MTVLRTLALAAAAAAFAAGALPPNALPAQQPTTYPGTDPNIQRIFRLGMDSSHVQQLGQALFDSVGPRLTGSPGIKAASD